MAHRKAKKAKSQRVSDKISILRRESVPEKQAIATAMSMERSGRLRRGGRYIHKRKGRKGGRK